MRANVYDPIIYVRGYAMTQGEIDQTAADPFCGFNIGSTVYRASPDKEKPARKFIFESPVVRLMSDFGYKDVFEKGMDIVDPGWTEPIPARSIIVYRYYDHASELLGVGKTPSIQDFALGLSALILKVKKLVCGHPKTTRHPDDFRCYLVAHSMGGLVCRAFLQNPALGVNEARACVDKVFTYATPHNGIEIAGFNVPQWLSTFDMKNFNRTYMANYLNLTKVIANTGDKRVDWLPTLTDGADWEFCADRFFCMIGTNRGDYDTAMGLSRTFSGHGSDGLVKIDNAAVWGIRNNDTSNPIPAPRAYAYRSHSGHFGIVNSEEAYQNLIRFLFGDVRIDIWADVQSVSLPEAVSQKARNKRVNANYLFEILASPRGKLWNLTRRTAEEDSAACRSYQELIGNNPAQKSIYLSSAFLGLDWRVDKSRNSLAYSCTLGVRVPEYEIDNVLWLDGHYEGGYLFRDTLIVEVFLMPDNQTASSIVYTWQSTMQSTEVNVASQSSKGNWSLPISFGNTNTPGISGTLRFLIFGWNTWRRIDRIISTEGTA